MPWEAVEAVERLAMEQQAKIEELCASQRVLLEAVASLRRLAAGPTSPSLNGLNGDLSPAKATPKKPFVPVWGPRGPASSEKAERPKDVAGSVPPQTFPAKCEAEKGKPVVPDGIRIPTFGIDGGLERRHFTSPPDHITNGTVTEEASRGQVRRHVGTQDHLWDGVTKASSLRPEFEGGLNRAIGHGKHHYHIPVKDHFKGWVLDESEERPKGIRMGYEAVGHGEAENHGRRHTNVPDHLFAGVLQKNGKDVEMSEGHAHGRVHFPVKDHFVKWATVDDKPCSHGHGADECFEDGLNRCVGHGKRHLENGLEAMSALLGPGRPAKVPEARPATAKAAQAAQAAQAVSREIPNSPAGRPSRYGL